MKARPSTSEMFQALQSGDRRSLARAITLCESSLLSDQREAAVLSQMCGDTTRNLTRRIGICGPPGVGKSTFIDCYGQILIDRGLKVAVLAVDPSSPMSGGSILGDKTRMPRLCSSPSAFVRPSPSKGILGGIARHTHEAIQLVEAAGFNIVVVETVGIGQSEVGIADHVDAVVGLQLPNAGDDLQAVKRGLMEILDVIVVNKADGDTKSLASRAVSHLTDGMSYHRSRHDRQVKVLPTSAVNKTGMEEFDRELDSFFIDISSSDRLKKLRQLQGLKWYRAEVEFLFGTELAKQPIIANWDDAFVASVQNFKKVPKMAAIELFDRVNSTLNSKTSVL